VLAGEHAYSHVNAFSFRMRASSDAGQWKSICALPRNGFAMLSEQVMPPEAGDRSQRSSSLARGRLGRGLNKTHAQLSRRAGTLRALSDHPLPSCRVSQDSRYGDSMERVLYNTILGAKPILPDGNVVLLLRPMTPAGARKVTTGKMALLSGTLPQLAADYHISIYLRSPAGRVRETCMCLQSSGGGGGAKEWRKRRPATAQSVN